MLLRPLPPPPAQADVSAGAQTGFSLLWWFGAVSLGCVSRGAAAAPLSPA